MRKTSLYRYFDKQGRLLYVGVSCNAAARLGFHSRQSRWYYEVVRVEIEHLHSLEHALFAEAVAIRDEAPLYNVVKPIPVEPVECDAENDDISATSFRESVTVKIPLEALRLLRIIAAATGEKQYAILTRLLREEAKRLNLLGWDDEE